MHAPVIQKPTIGEYHDAVDRLKAARAIAMDLQAKAEAVGDVGGVEKNLSALKAALDEFKDIRSRLSPKELFIVEFKVEVLGDRKIGFTIPAGTSRADILNRVADLHDQQLIEFPPQLFIEAWISHEGCRTTSSTPERIEVFGCVDGSASMNANEQRCYLARRGLEMCPRADLVVAAHMYSVVTGENMFADFELARAVGGDVGFLEQCGYTLGSIREDARDNEIVAAGRLPKGSAIKSLRDLPAAGILDRTVARMRAMVGLAESLAASA
jgi:hypothetical protein